MYPALVRARAGDVEAENLLAGEARAVLLSVVAPALRGGRYESSTEDVVQEALGNIHEGVAKCRATSRGQAIAWVRKVGQNCVADFLRNEQNKTDPAPLDAQLLAAHEPSPPSPHIASALNRLRVFLEQLSDDQQKLLWLRWVASRSWSEVAAELGTTDAGAKRRWQRLLRRLMHIGPP